jgi:hypothetical protein
LEERWCPSGDTYRWNPGTDNNNASNPANWQKLVNGQYVQQGANGTLPGQNGQSPDDEVDLYGFPVANGKDINWDKSFTFSKLMVGFGYNGTETIGPNGVTLDITGAADGTAVGADGFGGSPGYLKVTFADSAGIFQIDGNSKIASFTFQPSPGKISGTVLIDGGTTTICTGTYSTSSTLNGTLKIQGSVTAVEDKGKTQLVLDGNNSTIKVGNNALLQVDGGTGNTLISEKTAGNNDYIDVQNGGYLTYIGSAGVTDTFTAPVWVEQGGNMKLSGGGNLAITGAEQGTQNVSLYLEGNFQSVGGVTKLLPTSMTATSTSSVATLDSNTLTITVASGNPCTVDGTLSIDTTIGTYGSIVFNCDTLDFGGTLIVHVSGPNSGTCDELIVNGVLNLDSNLSMLDAVLDDTPNYPPQESWLVIYASGGISGSFSYIYPVNNMHYQEYNYPDYGDLTLYYGYNGY